MLLKIKFGRGSLIKFRRSLIFALQDDKCLEVFDAPKLEVMEMIDLIGIWIQFDKLEDEEWDKYQSRISNIIDEKNNLINACQTYWEKHSAVRDAEDDANRILKEYEENDEEEK